MSATGWSGFAHPSRPTPRPRSATHPPSRPSSSSRPAKTGRAPPQADQGAAARSLLEENEGPPWHGDCLKAGKAPARRLSSSAWREAESQAPAGGPFPPRLATAEGSRRLTQAGADPDRPVDGGQESGQG